MAANLVGLGILVGLVVLFAWLTWRAWKSKRALLKWAGVVGAGLLTSLFALLTVVYAKGLVDLYRPYPVAAVDVSIAGDPEQIARGEHLATVLCAACHSLDGAPPLTGGANMSDDSGLPLGDLYAPNITPAGRIKELSDGDLYRILRTGVEPGGRLTIMGFMPSHLSDADAQAVIAYLRSSQAVENQTPPTSYSPLLVFLNGAGLFSAKVPASLPSVTAPPKAATVEYGEYIVNMLDCRGCHGPQLTGDAPPPMPPGAPNLTVVVPSWSKDDFFQAMRTGVAPSGRQIQPPMPWQQVGKLDDIELEALYNYLHSLTAIAVK